MSTMSLIEFAHSCGRDFCASLSREEQKSLGQFMTPPAIATYMAKRAVAGVERSHICVLEPSAGAGILAAAVVTELLDGPAVPEHIEVILYEVDERLLPLLNRLADRMRRAASARGTRLTCSIRNIDFLLSKEAVQGHALVDILIANPPYLKLSKNDPRALAHAYAVHGQPNLYGLFLAACARLIKEEGRYCFITPRSWMNGGYFSSVRRQVLQWLHIDSLHLFESRKAHFFEDEILQEAVIIWATARSDYAQHSSIRVSRSQGVSDLAQATVTAMPFGRIVGADESRLIALHEQQENPFSNWTATLATYGLQVSTGPVVPFRAPAFLLQSGSSNSVPLLWMQHIQPMRVQWPIQKKREHIRAVADSAHLLVPNQPMVVLRRFSPKEAVRRVTAAPYEGGLPGESLGIENHLNYIYRPGGVMSADEARGLSAFLSSSLVDDYFRAVAGSTQVNATELRNLPLPPHAMIEKLGRTVKGLHALIQIDAQVREVVTGEADPIPKLSAA
ncbi:Eco57I restriction-modification methylase domain-containing protein [Achromobacter xylosoxidans]|uniref:Eco57I restriction-modification methylase domain-containing protein n=1 Tax=Alcaligenes xylosoxydans xylosoxydans TaxID=85698 RepID=UPI001EECDC70|nr:Eco57I restriction-modification methylase domain-containing protein [Achromobacter xylosoxidans]